MGQYDEFTLDLHKNSSGGQNSPASLTVDAICLFTMQYCTQISEATITMVTCTPSCGGTCNSCQNTCGTQCQETTHGIWCSDSTVSIPTQDM